MGELGTVTAIRRYPVKSMLGEDIQAVTLTASGLDGDRTMAVIDQQTGRIASAKHPRLWRGLLAFTAQWNNGAPRITLPDGTSIAAGDSTAGQVLSGLLNRGVRLTAQRPWQATLARPAPEDVIAKGEDADVPYETLEIGQGTPGTTFVDFAPVHLITTATLARVGAEMIRYRPNIVLDIPGSLPFAENGWTGREISIGQVLLPVILPTPRCAVPTLAHGTLPRNTDAVRTLLEHNRIPVPGHGTQPCLGAYAQVVNGGTISVGDRAGLT
jgi:uncharacterized protein YcbX